MRSVLITGARGLVGDSVLSHFYAQGWRIIVACSGSVRGIDDRLVVVPFKLNAVSGNTALRAALKEVDAVIHCAAILPSSGLAETHEGARDIFASNVLGTFDLMQMASASAVKTFVFISSANLYAAMPEVIIEDIPVSPPTPYALSKVAGEEAAAMFGRASKTNFISLRISAPYGARYTAQAVIPTFVSRALENKPLKLLGTGQRQQVFTYTADIARACETAINAAISGIYNIAGPGPVTMVELARAVLRIAGADETLLEFTGQPDPNEGMQRRVSLERARRVIGWEPLYNIDLGLAKMVEEIRNPLAPLLQPAVA